MTHVSDLWFCTSESCEIFSPIKRSPIKYLSFEHLQADWFIRPASPQEQMKWKYYLKVIISQTIYKWMNWTRTCSFLSDILGFGMARQLLSSQKTNGIEWFWNVYTLPIESRRQRDHNEQKIYHNITYFSDIIPLLSLPSVDQPRKFFPCAEPSSRSFPYKAILGKIRFFSEN